MASWNIKAPYYTDSEKKEAVFNYMSGKMTSQQTISEFGLADSTLRKYVKEVKDRLHECNHNLFPADFPSMNVTQIAKKYFSVDDKGLYIDKERSELIYLSVLAMDEDGRSVQSYFSNMELLVAVKALASEEKMNLGISHNNATRTAFLNKLIKVKGQATAEGVSPQTTARGDTRGDVRRDQRGDVRGAGGPTAVGGGGGMHIDDDAAADDVADNDIVYCHKYGHIEDSLKRACINKKCKLNTSNTHHNNLLQNRRLLPQVTLPNAGPLGVNGSLNFVYIPSMSTISCERPPLEHKKDIYEIYDHI